ncbi:multidrug effflux MFS transporter [Roseomonas sp. 18066]|uniref:multidrug effflux MFS transporter n=1 Tax=Roseomonas sp. 18066 TaxID=2681412 RepID=UPI001359F0DF|nr:multidrug effflux MFS transporter [Roseomonas sp. 18066]
MPQASNPAARPASGLRTSCILALLMGFASISTDMYLPAMPAMGAALQASPGRMALTLSGFLVGFSLGQLLWGPIGDRHGRRLPIAAGLVLFVIGSAGCALSETAWQLVGWRLVQALGACAGPVLARAMVRDLHGRERSAQILSGLMLVMAIAPLIAPILGGQVLAFGTWRSIFWILAGIGLVALLSLLALPESLPPARRSRAPLSGALRDYLLLARDPAVMGFALVGGFFYAGAFAYIAGTPFAYIAYYQVPDRLYGLLFGASILGVMATNAVNARLVGRFGSARLLRFGAAGLALSGLAAALQAGTGWGGLPALVAPLFVYMSMAGFIIANSVAGALAFHPRRAGAASALVGAVHYGSGVLSTALIDRFADGTPWTMGWLMAVGGLGSLAAATLLIRGPAAR